MRQVVGVCEQGKKALVGSLRAENFSTSKKYYILETESPSCNNFLIHPIRATFPAQVIRLN